jgi:hypothetical protein
MLGSGATTSTSTSSSTPCASMWAAGIAGLRSAPCQARPGGCPLGGRQGPRRHRDGLAVGGRPPWRLELVWAAACSGRVGGAVAARIVSWTGRSWCSLCRVPSVRRSRLRFWGAPRGASRGPVRGVSGSGPSRPGCLRSPVLVLGGPGPVGLGAAPLRDSAGPSGSGGFGGVGPGPFLRSRGRRRCLGLGSRPGSVSAAPGWRARAWLGSGLRVSPGPVRALVWDWARPRLWVLRPWPRGVCRLPRRLHRVAHRVQVARSSRRRLGEIVGGRGRAKTS